ncbi:hypothetical protein TN98_09475 [Pantoea anthophila]|nr:hypothetical protein TN98_09475 [Pantoea anthophila]
MTLLIVLMVKYMHPEANLVMYSLLQNIHQVVPHKYMSQEEVQVPPQRQDVLTWLCHLTTQQLTKVRLP